MGCMYRSDEMGFYELYFPPEQAFHVFNGLGEAGCVQVEDMTPHLVSYQRPNISELCRYVELDRILTHMTKELKKEGIDSPMMQGSPTALKPTELNTYETMLEKWDEEITETGINLFQLQNNLKNMQEMHYVLRNVDPILGDAELRRDPILLQSMKAGDVLKKDAGGGDPFLSSNLHIGTGVVRRSKCYAFEVMLWRVGRGNIFIRPAQKDHLFIHPETGPIRKVAFVAVCHGSKLKDTLITVCNAFHADMIACPRTYKERQDMISKLDMRIKDLNQVIRKSKYHRCKQLRMIARELDGWCLKVKKSKSIYTHLNLCSIDYSKKCMVGHCWIPTRDLKVVMNILRDSTIQCGSTMPSFLSRLETVLTPPTYHRTNRFTKGFQNLINSYGCSAYRELNPGLYTCITFPFLFSIMFGDLGHGIILFSFALWMVLYEKRFIGVRSKNDIWKIFFSGRYIMLLMGICTLYTGFIYNEVFSKPIRWRPSYWSNPLSRAELAMGDISTIHPASKTNRWYAMGVDPVWRLSENKILVDNSLKMKLSVILGFIHMVFGICLGLFNHLHFKRYYLIFLEFIPMLVIMVTIFGYLVFLIVYKWIFYGAKKKKEQYQPGCAPLLILVFIEMFLGSQKKADTDDDACSSEVFPGQATVQKILFYIPVLMVPILLFGTPIYKHSKNKKKRVAAKEHLDKYLKDRGPLPYEGIPDKIEAFLEEELHEYSETFADLMIHQGVHTIEYVLSTISHTASYLRLWALSLAHSQLSEMLFEMVLVNMAFTNAKKDVTGIVKTYLFFGVWAGFSLAILVLMEGLSAFLHTLRLHWVEFMSKFYKGDGKPFHAYSFHEIIYGDYKAEKIDCKNIPTEDTT